MYPAIKILDQVTIPMGSIIILNNIDTRSEGTQDIRFSEITKYAFFGRSVRSFTLTACGTKLLKKFHQNL